MIPRLNSQLVAKFEIKYLGATRHILGMELKEIQWKKTYGSTTVSMSI